MTPTDAARNLDAAFNPVTYLQQMLAGLEGVPHMDDLTGYAAWWEAHGRAISRTVDRAGTPGLHRFDRRGQPLDQIEMPAAYRDMLVRGYREGVVWRAFEGGLNSALQLGFVASFYDMGLYCPYTLSLVTARAIDRYAAPEVRDLFLPPLVQRDHAVWQGATWLTEIGGGSDLGSNVRTRARQTADGWLLTGEKFFCSNVDAEVVLVAALPEGAPQDVRSLAMFLMPRYRPDGELNYHIVRVKDKIATRSVVTGEVVLHESQAYLLGSAEHGIYQLLEALNLSRVCNSIGAVAVAQRALAEAYAFARERVVFGRPLLAQPLFARQLHQRLRALDGAFALTWETVRLLYRVEGERAGSYSEAWHLYRLMVHLAKYWTAELAVQTAKWTMEIWGGLGVLHEFEPERLLREAMIAAVWEGPPNRQILDGIEVMARRRSHDALLERLAPWVEAGQLAAVRAIIDDTLALTDDARDAASETAFVALARLAADGFGRQYADRIGLPT
jgi:alkylation response protein AidB-like acyl-CoA dehydrogenase